MRSALSILLAAVAACALVPAAAGAATISTDSGGGLVYQGEGSEGLSLLLSSTEVNGTKQLRFGDSGADHITINTPLCQADQYSSDAVVCDFSPTRPISIIGSDAKDSLSIFDADSVPDSVPVTIDGRGGDDEIKDAYDGQAGRTLIGGAGNDTIDGYGGDDAIDGGDGNDTLDGGEGSDTIHAGAGDDTLYGDHFKSPGADLLDGGPGTDQVEEWNIPDADVHPLPTVSLNGLADDGRPGEGDNVQNVETFNFYISATFVGSDAAEHVEIHNVADGASNLDGGGGNDVLKAYDTADTVNGGPGDDQLEGGLGNDTITGGPGKDTIMGDSSSSYCSYLGPCKVPFGNDTIYAQDGEPDQIDCGIGEDVAYVDAIDTVTNCETVNKSGAPAGGGSGGGSGTPAQGGTPQAALTLVGAGKVKALLAGRLKVAVPCTAACRITVTGRRGRTVVATGRATLLAAGTAKVKLRVSTKARRALRRSHKVVLSLTATVTAAGGAKDRLTAKATLA